MCIVSHEDSRVWIQKLSPSQMENMFGNWKLREMAHSAGINTTPNDDKHRLVVRLYNAQGSFYGSDYHPPRG